MLYVLHTHLAILLSIEHIHLIMNHLNHMYWSVSLGLVSTIERNMAVDCVVTHTETGYSPVAAFAQFKDLPRIDHFHIELQ